MTGITVLNATNGDIFVSVAKDGGDSKGAGSVSWYPLKAHGGYSTWSRTDTQVISYTRSQDAGAQVYTVLGVPGQSANIN